MIFHEIYSIYYKTVAKIIEAAINEQLNKETMNNIINENAFGESRIYIQDEIQNNWKLIDDEYQTPIFSIPNTPLTTLQKRFIKTICRDSKIKLFIDIECDFDVDPLFNEDDIIYFDKFHNGDNYDDLNYIKNFRKIIEVIKNKGSCYITFVTAKGVKKTIFNIPQRIEYSRKNDKFRIMSNKYIINISSIINIAPCEKKRTRSLSVKYTSVTVIIYDHRYALNRAMIAFSNFKKDTVNIGHREYEMTIHYPSHIETELLIRIMSFGQFMYVKSPIEFQNKIVQRLLKQQSLMNDFN